MMFDLSVVLPVRDEEENIPEVVERLTKTLDEMKVSYEILFVTDLNKDNTVEVIKGANRMDKRVKLIKLSNSYGQHVAVIAGLNFCKGQSVVIMDGDLQDYPEDIPGLYKKLSEGFDVVYAVKKSKNDSLLRNMASSLFIGVLNRLSDVRSEHNTSMFRIISRRMVDEVLKFRERQPSLTFVMNLIGFPTSSVEVTSGERKRGKTKYNPFRLMNLGISSLISFSTKPLRLISMVGFVVAALSFIYLCIVLIQALFFSIDVLGWPTIISLITCLGGIQLFVIGIIGEYIGRIFIESKGRPLYIIDETIGDVM
jgi:glycosyltransferase involved in cell wall biosynthesis